MAVTNQSLAIQFSEDPTIMAKFGYVQNIDMFVIYDETSSYFKVLQKKDMTRKIHMFVVKNADKNVTMGMVGDIVEQIKTFLPLRFDDVVSPYIGLKDFTILDIRDFSIQKASVNVPCFHKLELTSTQVIEGSRDTPLWDTFLSEVLVNEDGVHDESLKNFLQEVFGYILHPSLESHASFFFVGGGGNGKSVTLDVLRELMGEAFCDEKSIETLTTNQFAAADLLGKRLNICNEEESKFIKSDKFKALVSGDKVSVRRLYEAAFSWKPTVKFVYSTNKVPSFAGFNKGLLRRIYLLPFKKEIEKSKRDTTLTTKLLREISGITLWALEGTKRLVENGFQFSASEMMDKSKEEFSEMLSPAVLFFNEHFDEESRGSPEEIHLDHLYEEYIAWNMKRGKKPLNHYNFYEDLQTAEKITKKMYDSKKLSLVRIRTGFESPNVF